MRTTGPMLAVFIACLAQTAQAETLFTCGASSGYGYFPPGGLVPEADAGWQEDAISSGSFSLVTLEDGSADIVFSDTRGTYSTRGDGGQVVVTYTAPDAIQVVTFYTETGVTETYTFMIDLKLLMWTQSKAGTPVPKIAAFTASCS